MPKVKNPLFSQEARGGIGGLVYNTWRGISYVKTNTSPTGQGTEKRLASQSLMTSVSKLWQGITDIQRAAWSQFGTDHPVTDWTGSPKRLTGMNWFCKCNILLKKLGLTTVSAAPTAAAPSPPSGLNITYGTSAIWATWSTPATSSQVIMFNATAPISAGVEGKLEMSAFASYCSSSVAPPFPIVASPTSGRVTVFAKCVDASSGLPSPYVSDYVDVT
jgi:hypothetical protein